MQVKLDVGRKMLVARCCWLQDVYILSYIFMLVVEYDNLGRELCWATGILQYLHCASFKLHILPQAVSTDSSYAVICTSYFPHAGTSLYDVEIQHISTFHVYL